MKHYWRLIYLITRRISSFFIKIRNKSAKKQDTKYINWKESDYISALSRYFEYPSEVSLPNRLRPDLTSDTHVYEVEFGKDPYSAIGQALVYSHYTKKAPAIIFLMGSPRESARYFKVFKEVTDKYGIEVHVFHIRDRTTGELFDNEGNLVYKQ